MKTLLLIGGTMGVGKTAVCQNLKTRLPHSVFFDGDWAWDASPFVVNEETKEVALSNICHTLNNFLHCSAYENILFSWVMHTQEIIDTLLSRLDTADCKILVFSLVCTPSSLRERLQKDINNGFRQEDIIEKSLARITLYNHLNTIKIDTSDIFPDDVARKIIDFLNK